MSARQRRHHRYCVLMGNVEKLRAAVHAAAAGLEENPSRDATRKFLEVCALMDEECNRPVRCRERRSAALRRFLGKP